MALVAEARWPARTHTLLFRLAASSVDHIAGNKVEFQVEISREREAQSKNVQ